MGPGLSGSSSANGTEMSLCVDVPLRDYSVGTVVTLSLCNWLLPVVYSTEEEQTGTELDRRSHTERSV